jgi:hypothetical protein
MLIKVTLMAGAVVAADAVQPTVAELPTSVAAAGRPVARAHVVALPGDYQHATADQESAGDLDWPSALAQDDSCKNHGQRWLQQEQQR